MWRGIRNKLSDDQKYRLTFTLVVVSAIGLLYVHYLPIATPPAPPTSLDHGLVGHWTFDDVEFTRRGATIHDRAAIPHDLDTPRSAGDRRAFDVHGGALRFSDAATSTDYLHGADRADDLDLGTSDFSGTAWVWLYTLREGDIFRASILSKYPGKDRPGFDFRLASHNALAFSMSDGEMSATVLQYAAVPTAEEWHLVAFTVDREHDALKLYVDGTNVAPYDRQDSPVPQGSVGNATDLRIGGYPGSQGFGGMIDEVRLYNRALGAEEIATIYQLGR
jgi:hypothetical protein